MRTEPIPTKSTSTASYCLLAMSAVVLVVLLAAFLSDTLTPALSSIGSLMLGLPQR